MRRKPKILCFHPALAPYRVDFFNLLGEFADLKVIFLQENLLNQQFDQHSLLSRINVPFEIWHGRTLKGQHLRWGIGHLISRETPDIILGFESSLLTVQALLWKKVHLNSNIQIWTTMDDSPSQVRSRSGIRRVVRDFVLRSVSRVIVPSQSAADAYVSLSTIGNQLSTGLFSVVPIVHDTAAIRRNASSVYSAARKWRELNCPEEWKHVMLFVGRLTEIKNLPWIIDRVAEMPETIGFVLVGDGIQESELKKYVMGKGLKDRVLFAGRKEGDELYSVMAGSDLLVLASKSETFGAVVAEGLSWGTPCIVSDNCGAATLIEDSKNGCVFKFNDIESFKDAFYRIPPRSEKSLLQVDLKNSVKSLINTLKF